MDSRNIGSLMLPLRRSMRMTKIDLAEELCITDKTISYWDIGHSLPDIFLIPVIADIVL